MGEGRETYWQIGCPSQSQVVKLYKPLKGSFLHSSNLNKILTIHYQTGLCQSVLTHTSLRQLCFKRSGHLQRERTLKEP